MNIIKNLGDRVENGSTVAMIISVVLSVLFVTALVQAATTISTNITSDGKITTNYASSTVFSVNNTAFFGGTATTTINGAGNLFVVGSTTLQAFTASQGTVTSATSTDLYSTTYLASGSTTLQNFVFQNATSSNTLTFKTATTTHTNAATSTLSVGCIQTYATSTATAIRIEFGVNNMASTTFRTGAPIAVGGGGQVVWVYGTCP